MTKFLSWVAVILWASLVFYLSHQPAEASSELSGGVTEVIAQIVEKWLLTWNSILGISTVKSERTLTSLFT